jgi:PAS domain-containing protein
MQTVVEPMPDPDRARAVLRALPTAAIVVLPSGTIAFCNDAAAELLGRDVPFVEGRAVADVLAPIDRIARAARRGARDEVAIDRPDGIPIRVRMKSAPCPAWRPRSAMIVALEAAPEVPAEASETRAAEDTAALLRLAVRTRRPVALHVDVDGARASCVVVGERAADAAGPFDPLLACFG